VANGLLRFFKALGQGRNRQSRPARKRRMGQKIARCDSNDSQEPDANFARKNFFADSFLGLPSRKAKHFPRVAALHNFRLLAH